MDKIEKLKLEMDKIKQLKLEMDKIEKLKLEMEYVWGEWKKFRDLRVKLFSEDGRVKNYDGFREGPELIQTYRRVKRYEVIMQYLHEKLFNTLMVLDKSGRSSAVRETFDRLVSPSAEGCYKEFKIRHRN